MNGNGFKTSSLAVAIATTLAVSGAVTPAKVYAKTATEAIIGTGADAIIGTGRSKRVSSDAIIGTGANAIIGTGADAIIGTGRSKRVSRDAIIGTGANAIIGTGADAIIGTGKAQVLMMGAIDKVDVSSNTISVLGRSLKMHSVAKIEESLAGGRQLMVALSGRISDSGAGEHLNLRFMPTDYVAGTSKVVVSGRVSELNASVGTMKVGGATVDISSTAPEKTPIAGSLVLLVGTQPVRQGVVIAEQLYVK